MDQNPGAIALVGSGEYSVQMQELETQLLHRAISRGKKNTFIQIPTASSHEGDASRAKWKRLGQEQSDRIGSECIYLPIHEREDAFNREFVENIRGMAFGGSIMGLRRSHHSEGLALLPDIEVIPHYDKMLGWLPDRVAAFIAQSVTRGTLLGIDENTALVLTDSWRKYGRGKVHVLRGSLDFEE